MPSNKIRGLALVSTLVLSGGVVSTPTAIAAPAPQKSTTAQARLDEIRRIVAKYPAAALLRQDLTRRGVPLPAGPLPSLLGEACETDTELARLQQKYSTGMTSQDSLVLALTGAAMLPFQEAASLDDTSRIPVSLTGDGPALQRTFAQLQGFWDTKGDDIQLVGTDGSMLADRARVQAAYEASGMPTAIAARLGVLVADHVATSPWFAKGRNPLFSLNAMAVSTRGATDAPDRIIMGRGLVQAYRDLGHGVVAPRLVMAHEYGHHVQFEIGMTSTIPTPSRTRRTELHADASATYFLGHHRGARFTKQQLSEAEKVSFGIGDCGRLSPGHHGTPAQRGRAAAWGVRTAAANGDKVMPAAAFRVAYDKALPQLLRPTAPAVRPAA